MIKAVIFDMDGLLIDSEPFWVEAEIKILGQLGVPLTPDMATQTSSGLREDEVVAYWHERYPWQGTSNSEVADRIEHEVAGFVRRNGKAMPGVYSTIALCLSKNLLLAIASSSSLQTINAVIDKLDISRDISVIGSAYNEPLGKPHPAVYLTTLGELNRTSNRDLHTEECLVFEDSANGVTSAKAAGMKCVAVPSSDNMMNPSIQAADKVIRSLEDFNEKMLELYD